MLVLTTGQIRDQIERDTGQPVDRDAVAYAIRKGGIQAIQRAGMVRLFSPDTVAQVRHFLETKRNYKHEIK